MNNLKTKMKRKLNQNKINGKSDSIESTEAEMNDLRPVLQKLSQMCQQLVIENRLLREKLIKSSFSTESDLKFTLDLDYISEYLLHLSDYRLNARNANKTKAKPKRSEESTDCQTNDLIGIEYEMTVKEELSQSSDQNISSDETSISAKPKPIRPKNMRCEWPGCEKRFASNYHLRRHYYSHSGERPYVCPFDGCDYASTHVSSLNVHKRLHTGERPFRCTHEGCNFSSVQQSGLKAHIRHHSGETPFLCEWPDCGQAFKFRATYAYHKKKHLNDRSFVCSFDGCRKGFITKNELKNHEPIHTGQHKYQCTWPGCDKKFISNHKLDIHMQWHTNDRRYPCDWPGCEWKALRASDLKKHRKTHTGERPFPCDTCELRFANVNNLKEHRLVVHEKVKRFVCQHKKCGKSFSVKRLLLEHQKRDNH